VEPPGVTCRWPRLGTCTDAIGRERGSAMKTIYFVRHGSTDGNETGAYQLHTIPLSEKGLAQAAFVAERFKTIPVDVIVSSDMTRAAQTADRIARTVGRSIVHSAFFHEILRPSAVRGKLKADPEVMRVTEYLIRYFADDSQRHSDEENFFDIRRRAVAGLDFLAQRPEEHILVVTHGTILTMLMAVMIDGEDTTPAFFLKLDRCLHASNTGITKCLWRDGAWRLVVWNDHAHLG
jgi:2,3-bisphosphoglycerate-dependent phosphoglycerate mutase